jgi:hypothetical protein
MESDLDIRAEQGFYRHRNGTPVAVYRSGDRLVHKVGENPPAYVTPEWEERFLSYCQSGYDAKAYWEARRTGKWEDHIRVGDNRPPEGVDAIVAELEELADVVTDMVKAGPAKTEQDANKAANLKARVDVLLESLDDEIKSAQRPHQLEINRIEAQKKEAFESIKAIHSKYGVILERMRFSAKNLVELVVAPFLIRKRQEQRDAGQVQITRGGKEKAVATNVGPSGAKISLVTRWEAEVEDYAKALDALKDHDKVRAAVQAVADSAARSAAKLPIPGVKYVSKETTR